MPEVNIRNEGYNDSPDSMGTVVREIAKFVFPTRISCVICR